MVSGLTPHSMYANSDKKKLKWLRTWKKKQCNINHEKSGRFSLSPIFLNSIAQNSQVTAKDDIYCIKKCNLCSVYHHVITQWRIVVFLNSTIWHLSIKEQLFSRQKYETRISTRYLKARHCDSRHAFGKTNPLVYTTTKLHIFIDWNKIR